MALLDTLRKRMSNVQKPKTQATDVGALEAQITAGQTGREQQAKGPAVSGIGSQLAAQQAQAQQGALTAEQQQATEQLAGQMALSEEQQALAEKGLEQKRGQALAGITSQQVMAAQRRQAEEDAQAEKLEAQSSMYADEITNAFANHLKDLATERGIAEQDMFASFDREQKSLNAEKAAARLHQLGHIMALSDRQYVDAITAVARERNLRDDLAFQQESYEIMMGKDLELMQDRMDFQAVLNKSEREFAKEMAEMDIKTALELAEIAAKEKNYVQAIKGTTTLAKSGVSMYLSGQGDSDGESYTYTTAKEERAGQSLLGDRFGTDGFGYYTENKPRDFSSFDSWIRYDEFEGSD